ncbi:MAG TPA: hypothetical protein VFE78_19840 [Gemmataceae bacterium]|jgi:nitroreductase|nr:hypothetical protein [Gemmataceae bacterium]
MTTKTTKALSKATPALSKTNRAISKPPAPPPAGYFRRAATEFAKAWRGERPGMGAWCLAYWPFPVTAFILAALAVGWVATPGAVPVAERFKEKLEATNNWSEVRFLQSEPRKAGGTYVALATYGQKYRCKVRAVGAAVTVQFYRPNGVRPNGAEVSKPVATYEAGEDGQLHAGAANTESLGQAAQEALDAIRPGAK